jgi:uncharacterized FAD-dependent dehydrogenase
VYHIGTDYLHEIGKRWYDYLVDKGVNFMWETEVTRIDFSTQEIFTDNRLYGDFNNKYDKLIFAVGKSGIDFGKQLAEKYYLPTEPKSVQIGIRFEAPQKYFQKLIDVSYDFKLYQKPNENVSIRTFCTNNNAAYVAVEETYGDISYNGHAKKGEEFRNDMTNFGILMEIKGIENPFEWSRNIVNKLQKYGTGLYYSPSRTPGLTSENIKVSATPISSRTLNNIVKPLFGGYFQYIEQFIEDLGATFPKLQKDWGIYIPEVKYLSPEPLVDYKNLSLNEYPNVYFVGDALSARGICVSGAQAIYVAEDLIRQ